MDIERAVLLHGKPKATSLGAANFDASRANWLGWLQDVLEYKGVEVVSLKPTTLLRPDYSDWARQINGVCHGVDLRKTAMVGHSLGCSAYLRWLSSQPSVGLGGLVMVAPWLGTRPQDGSFSKFAIDKTLGQRISDIVVINSRDDISGGVPESIGRILEAMPLAEVVDLDNYGHFVTGNRMDADYSLGNGLKGSTFPALGGIMERLELF